MTTSLTLADSNYKIIKFSGDRSDFEVVMKNNPGILIFKFTAEWCVPCKKIKEYSYKKSNELPEYIKLLEVDVDESFDIYAFLKHKKMVNGIPVFLAYAKDVNEAPVASVMGTNLPDIEEFFAKCINYKFSNSK